MVQPTGPKNQQKTLHRKGRGEVIGGSPCPWQQVGPHLQTLPWSNR
ncbi:hypothetical protein LINPERPRIM_LOCUS13171 [Linum perenne]